MIILTLRTDKPEAELGLYDGQKRLEYISWRAHRELSDTLHMKIKDILNKSSIPLEQLQGIVCFKGPGSFTGLRIGLTVANALAYSYNIPIIAKSGEKWRQEGISDILAGLSNKIATPEYGEAAKTTRHVK